jgi:hypothetical protein
MLWHGSELLGYSIKATDGLIGSISDLLFDDEDWTLRWAVADTSEWLPGRLVLLPTSALGRPNAQTSEFAFLLVALYTGTRAAERDQVDKSEVM